MPKLPTLKWRTPPAGYRERLARWFDIWKYELELRRENPEYAKPPPALPPESRTKHMGFGQRHPFDADLLATGQIRLLGPGVLPQSRRPVYVAVLSEWEDGMFLIAPFGPFMEPATTSEWLTGRDAFPLRVLCLWNAHTVPRSSLAESWEVDDLSPQELADARSVFDHVFTGDPLSDRLLDRVGCPVVHPNDPRIAYQQEEARQMAPLAVAAREYVCQITQPTEEPTTLAAVLEDLTAVFRSRARKWAAASGEKNKHKKVWDSGQEIAPFRCVVYRESNGDLRLSFSSTDHTHENQTFEVVVKEQTRPTVTFLRDSETGELFGEVLIPHAKLPPDGLSRLTFRLKKP